MCCLLVLLLLLLHVCGCLWLPPFLRSCCALFVCLPSMSTASRLCRIFSFFSLFLQLCPLPCVLCVLCVILRPVFKFNCCGNCTHEPLSQSERLRLRLRLRHGVGLGLGTDIGFARVDCGRDRLDFQSKCSAREQLHSRHAPVSYVPSPLYWAFLILVNKILSNF